MHSLQHSMTLTEQPRERGTETLVSFSPESYYASLSEREQQGYRVAMTQLGSTFDVVKTRGFLAWKEKIMSHQSN